MKIIKLIIALLTISVFAQAQVSGSSHDLSSGGPTAQRSDTVDSRICVFCHTPHNGSADELWNRANPTDPAFAGLSNGSLRCLSCHDGATAVNNLTTGPTYDFTTAMSNNTVIGNDGSNNPILVGGGDIGTDLSNDHPVGVTYPVGGGNGLHPATSVNLARLPGGKVECSSCHDPHDISFGAFMIASNAGSALCLDCHDK